MKTLFVYLPCYNEAGNIRALVEEWVVEQARLAAEGYDLIVTPIDDKSTDNTLAIIRQLEKTYPCVRAMAHEQNQNLGGVVNTAIHDFMRISHQGDVMGLMDGDDTHKPEYIHAMLAKLSAERHCVIASRYQPGAAVQGLQANRKLFSDGARVYYTVMLHVPKVRDYTCGYRVYTRPAILAGFQRYGERLVEMKSFACMMELLYKLHLSGCVFDEVPFTLHYDCKEGASKMNVWKTVKDSFFTAMKLRFQHSR